MLSASSVALADPGEGGGRVHRWTETVETAAADSATSTYLMARLPSNARILGASTLYWDDLATTGSPTLDIGVYPVRTGDITADVDALSNGHAVSSAGTGAKVVQDKADYGKRLYEFVNGQTTDPKCDLDIKAVLADAALSSGGGGTITVDGADLNLQSILGNVKKSNISGIELAPMMTDQQGGINQHAEAVEAAALPDLEVGAGHPVPARGEGLGLGHWRFGYGICRDANRHGFC